MKILFKKENFSEELQNLVGYVDRDIRFEALNGDLLSASKEMQKLIGADLYDFVCEKYDNDDEEDIEQYESLIRHVKYPIAINALRFFSHTSDLQHTEHGRMMRSDEHEKSPFEWMIKRDNQEQERKYYRALDDLITFLEDTENEKWLSSTAREQQNQFFVNNTDCFDKFFLINSRLLLLKLTPGIRQCENSKIIPLIGLDKFGKLKEDFWEDSVEDEDKLLLEMIQEACVYYSLFWGMKRLSALLFPESTLQNFIPDEKTKSKKTEERYANQLAAQEFERDAVKVLKRIEDFISTNENEIDPEPNDPFEFGFDADDNFATF